MANNTSVVMKSFKTANQIARAYGCNRATEIVVSDDSCVLEVVSYGYRKCTTGEYVPSTYRSNFGWKNTYYQRAICRVSVNIEYFY